MPIARCGFAVHREFQVRLADDAKDAQSCNAIQRAHDVDHLVGLCFKRPQVLAIDFDRQFAFDAADRLLHVVGDGLREVPDHTWHLLQLAIHGADQLFLVLVKDRTPLIFRLEIDEILGVEEAGGVCAVVGTSYLANHLASPRGRPPERCAPYSSRRCPRSGRCWAPACRAPRSRLRPGAAGTPTRSRRSRPERR